MGSVTERKASFQLSYDVPDILHIRSNDNYPPPLCLQSLLLGIFIIVVLITCMLLINKANKSIPHLMIRHHSAWRPIIIKDVFSLKTEQEKHQRLC